MNMPWASKNLKKTSTESTESLVKSSKDSSESFNIAAYPKTDESYGQTHDFGKVFKKIAWGRIPKWMSSPVWEKDTKFVDKIKFQVYQYK